MQSRCLPLPNVVPCSTPPPCFYMDKIAVGPEAADAIDITAPVAEKSAQGRQGEEVLTIGPSGVHPRSSASR